MSNHKFDMSEIEFRDELYGKPNQWFKELNRQAISRWSEFIAPILYNLARYARATSTAEIGTAYGYVTVALAQAMKELGGKHYAIEQEPKYVAHTKKICMRYGVEDCVEFLLGDSKEVAFDAELDIIFIDGGHETDQVIAEIKKYFPLMKNDGLMTFHDYLRPPKVGVALESSDVKPMRDKCEVINFPYESGFTIWRKKG